MRLLWILFGIVLTIYCFISGAPLWIIAFNIVFDMWALYSYFRNTR